MLGYTIRMVSAIDNIWANSHIPFRPHNHLPGLSPTQSSPAHTIISRHLYVITYRCCWSQWCINPGNSDVWTLGTLMYQPWELWCIKPGNSDVSTPCNHVFTRWSEANEITLPAKKTLRTVAAEHLYFAWVCLQCDYLTRRQHTDHSTLNTTHNHTPVYPDPRQEANQKVVAKWDPMTHCSSEFWTKGFVK